MLNIHLVDFGSHQKADEEKFRNFEYILKILEDLTRKRDSINGSTCMQLQDIVTSINIDTTAKDNDKIND